MSGSQARASSSRGSSSMGGDLAVAVAAVAVAAAEDAGRKAIMMSEGIMNSRMLNFENAHYDDRLHPSGLGLHVADEEHGANADCDEERCRRPEGLSTRRSRLPTR